MGNVGFTTHQVIFQDGEMIAEISQSRFRDTVAAINLAGIILANNAPRDIDYISIDTEGSEFSILKELDLNKYNVSIFTVEHNFIEEKKNKNQKT